MTVIGAPMPSFVMAGLVPAIHDLFAQRDKQDVDARDKPRHDGINYGRTP
jgi:hypothetical protein